MKKILHIVEAFGGGVFSVLADLINGTKNDYEIVVAHGIRKEMPNNFKSKFYDGIKFIQVENFTRNINIIKDLKALIEIKKIIKKEKPDIIHLHSSKAGVLGRIAVRGKEIKMFYNPHGFSFLKQDDTKLKRGVYWLIEKITAIINPKCIIVGCSQGEYDEARKLNKNAVLINNGIDIVGLGKEITKLQDRSLDYSNFRICTIGRIGYQKSPYMFNEIAEKLPNINFTWIGDGELKEELKSKNITITGWKTKDNVLEILNENDIFILTSLWEGLPISLLEAMYMKKICIVTNVIGNRDVIKNKVNGFVCNNVKEFEDVIKDIQMGKFNISNIIQNSYNDVINEYNTEIMCKKYIKEFER